MKDLHKTIKKKNKEITELKEEIKNLNINKKYLIKTIQYFFNLVFSKKEKHIVELIKDLEDLKNNK